LPAPPDRTGVSGLVDPLHHRATVHFAAEVHVRRLGQEPQRDFPRPFLHNGGILLGKVGPRTLRKLAETLDLGDRSVRKVGVPRLSASAALASYLRGSLSARGEAQTEAGCGGVASGPTMQFASILVHAVNNGVLRPSPADDFDRFCTPALLVQDGAGPFSGFVLADRPPGVDPHSTFVLTRLRGEDDVKAVVARFYSFGGGPCSIRKYSSST
jgi:hypothetical protein